MTSVHPSIIITTVTVFQGTKDKPTLMCSDFSRQSWSSSYRSVPPVDTLNLSTESFMYCSKMFIYVLHLWVTFAVKCKNKPFWDDFQIDMYENIWPSLRKKVLNIKFETFWHLMPFILLVLVLVAAQNEEPLFGPHYTWSDLIQ